ncbi:MAG: hypothetical protein PHX74_12210 [Candidatus Sumerlaeales bacterium]|nr:hypothetical protein [Candidatus Sumerlaeales bacterium]
MRHLVFMTGLLMMTAFGLSGCNTTFPGTLGFATWEFQFSHKKPVYPLKDISQPVITQKQCTQQ